MLASSVPVRFQQPFANNAGVSYTRAIPNTTTDPAAASLNLGFPPACFVDVALGGTPPNGMDFNGILYEITANNQWVQAGGFAAYDSAFSTAIGGYPNNAVLQMATGKGFWKSTADNNTSNPDASGANWIPAAIAPGAYLDLNVAGAVDVTLTSVQAANRVIDLFGALTGNINIIVPTATGSWIFNNGTSGNFTITVKTAAGTGVLIDQGTSAEAWCDAVNVYAGGLLHHLADLRYALSNADGSNANVKQITGNTALDVSDFGKELWITAAAALTLPNTASVGWWFVTPNTLSTVTVASTATMVDASQTVLGSPYALLANQTYLISNLVGSRWDIIALTGRTPVADAVNANEAVARGQLAISTTPVTPLPAAGAAINVAHGLGATPAVAYLILTCLTADAGFSPGDEIICNTQYSGSAFDPVQVRMDATNVGFNLLSTSTLGASNKTTSAPVALTVGNWSYKFLMRKI